MAYHKVSVIIPCYNEEQYLPKCLESIKTLEYPENYLEVIVVDNGSTDETLQIAHEYGVKVMSIGFLMNKEDELLNLINKKIKNDEI